MKRQVFLGGACGGATWRRRIAIPALEAAGVTYYDPQRGIGEWTPAREEEEMRAKASAGVLLFVINAQTRGVASIGEVAYGLGAGWRLALVVTDIGEADRIDGVLLPQPERNDLNRGRIFVRSMARQNGVPVFDDVETAVEYAIGLVRGETTSLTVEPLRAILGDVHFRDGVFMVEEVAGGFLIQLQLDEFDAGTGARQTCFGRRWHIAATASESDIVRTAFKAAVTWQEHEAREGFTYRGASIFGAHSRVEDLVRLFSG